MYIYNILLLLVYMQIPITHLTHCKLVSLHDSHKLGKWHAYLYAFLTIDNWLAPLVYLYVNTSVLMMLAWIWGFFNLRTNVIKSDKKYGDICVFICESLAKFIKHVSKPHIDCVFIFIILSYESSRCDQNILSFVYGPSEKFEYI